MNDNHNDLTKSQLIGRRIKAERTKNKNRAMTQTGLARKMFTTQNTISNWETGKVVPSMEQLIRLAEIFKCDVSYLLCDYDDRSITDKWISERTGLSVEAVEWLKTANPDYIDVLNKLLEHGELAGLLLSSMYLYAVSTYTHVKYIDSITDSERDFDLSESKALIKSEAQDSISLVLDRLRSIYRPYTEKLADDKIRLLKLELEDMKNGQHQEGD